MRGSLLSPESMWARSKWLGSLTTSLTVIMLKSLPTLRKIVLEAYRHHAWLGQTMIFWPRNNNCSLWSFFFGRTLPGWVNNSSIIWFRLWDDGGLVMKNSQIFLFFTWPPKHWTWILYLQNRTGSREGRRMWLFFILLLGELKMHTVQKQRFSRCCSISSTYPP